MALTPLDPTSLAEALTTLPDWHLSEGKLRRTFRFEDFSAAFGFMTQVALRAEAADHHPEWSNVYSRVEIALVTHDAGAITGRDIALARAIDNIVSR